MITIACVRTGTKYGIEYVERLRNMVARHLPLPHRFVCLTDQKDNLPGVDMVDISHLELPGWWGKLAVFHPGIFRPDSRCLYFDLDTVIVGDLSPLAELQVNFGICRNFTKLAGHPTWPCNYGSCVMSFATSFGNNIFQKFMGDKDYWIGSCPHGDQQAIERIYPIAAYLQDRLPPGYFVGRRNFTNEKPPGASVMIFAGKHKPHNTPHQWLREAWG